MGRSPTAASGWIPTSGSPLFPCICLSISSSTIVSFPDAFRISSLPACLTSDTDLARHPYLEIVSCQPHRRQRLRKRCASPLRTQRLHTDGIMTSTSNTPYATPGTSTPTTRPGTPSSQQPTPATTPADNQLQDDSSKLRTFLSLLRKFIGVTDIANVRFSLPSQLLEPIPNLEYWHYLDRPETFASIGTSDDAVGRMLEVLRFWFTKDLKYVKGKPCKPYNSTLGEFFRVCYICSLTPTGESQEDHN